MFSKLSIAIVSSLAILAAATPVPTDGGSTNQCTSGTQQCCNGLTKADDPATSKLLGLLGIVIQDVNVLVGVTCSPISIVGVNSGSWCVYVTSSHAGCGTDGHVLQPSEHGVLPGCQER
jgi:hypothetical protein